MPKQPEGKLVQRIKILIADQGGRSFKIVGNDEGLQEIGIPDLLVCYRGWFIGMEAKQSSGKLRPMQRKALREIYDAGGVAAVVETVGQAARLLSYLKDRSPLETSSGLCYDRGAFNRRCQFS